MVIRSIQYQKLGSLAFSGRDEQLGYLILKSCIISRNILNSLSQQQSDKDGHICLFLFQITHILSYKIRGSEC